MAAARSWPCPCWSTCSTSPPAQATTGSLVVVGVTSLIGGDHRYRAGNVLLGRGRDLRPRRHRRRGRWGQRRPPGSTRTSCWPRSPLCCSSSAGHWPGASYVTVAETTLGTSRGPLWMTRSSRSARPSPASAPGRSRCCSPRRWSVLLTGFLGVGGGFLVVPALLLALALPMDLRRRHLPGRHHHHERRSAGRPRRLWRPAGLDLRCRPHRGLGGGGGRWAHGWPTASTPTGCRAPSPSWSSASPSAPPPRHSPRSSDLLSPRIHHATPSSRNVESDMSSTATPGRRGQNRGPRPHECRSPWAPRSLGHRPRQARHDRLAAGHRRPRRVRAPGRAQPVGSRLAGRRLGVGAGPRAGTRALRRQRLLGHPGRGPLHRRPGHRGRGPAGAGRGHRASSRPSPASPRSSHPRPGATISPGRVHRDRAGRRWSGHQRDGARRHRPQGPTCRTCPPTRSR